MSLSIVRSAKNSDNVPIIVWANVAASQTINKGDLVQVNSTSKLLEVAVAASTSIVGIAESAITTTASPTVADKIAVTLVRREVVRITVDQTGTKKTFADTDKYLIAYDLKNQSSINPDDTTGGMCYVQAYDNTNNTVDVIFAEANLANVG